MKIKVCKGIGRAVGIGGCGKQSNNRKFGLCPSCLIHWAYNNEYGKVWYAKSFLPKVKKVTKQHKDTKKRKDKEKITLWRPKLQTKIQQISRLIDIGLPCLARGYHSGQIHGGHVWGKGSNTTMALNLHNIHRQSAQSNKWGNDDGLLRERLGEEYGESYLDFVRGLKTTPTLHWANVDYMDFYTKACKISNELRKKGERFDLNDRIKMRNEINLELGIYENEQCVY